MRGKCRVPQAAQALAISTSDSTVGPPQRPQKAWARYHSTISEARTTICSSGPYPRRANSSRRPAGASPPGISRDPGPVGSSSSPAGSSSRATATQRRPSSSPRGRTAAAGRCSNSESDGGPGTSAPVPPRTSILPRAKANASGSWSGLPAVVPGTRSEELDEALDRHRQAAPPQMDDAPGSANGEALDVDHHQAAVLALELDGVARQHGHTQAGLDRVLDGAVAPQLHADLQPHPRLAGGHLHRQPGSRARLSHEEALALEVAEGQVPAPGQAMAPGHDHHQLVVHEGGGDQVGVGDGRAEHPEVDHAPAQPFLER